MALILRPPRGWRMMGCTTSSGVASTTTRAVGAARLGGRRSRQIRHAAGGAGRAWLDQMVRGWLDQMVAVRQVIPGSWRRIRSLSRGLLAVTALSAAAVLVAGPAAAVPAAAMVAPGPGPAAARAGHGGTPRVDVRGADLVNARTGAMLWGKEVSVPRPMGSITKVMTALIVLRAGDLSRQIKVSRGAIRYVRRDGASSAGLIAGDVLTTRQLLEAMLLPSGCDAAYLLATAYGPGRDAFVQKMNAMAQAMGLTSTHFTSFDGMPFPTEHSTYSTPADLVRLGEQAMRDPLFRRIVAQRRYHLAATSQHHHYTWYTTDGMLGSSLGVTGIKTGDTDAAGDCFLFEARRGGQTLIGVVLHARADGSYASFFTAARRLLTWGFREGTE
jgi:serine-type D-Ala-D-Ala carboxypeptidase (penicillin-binding protein 5/6)